MLAKFWNNQVTLSDSFNTTEKNLTTFSYSATLGISAESQPKLTVLFCLGPKSPGVKWLKRKSTAHVRSSSESQLRTVLFEAETYGTLFRKPEKACTVRNKRWGQKCQAEHLAPNSSRSSRDFFGVSQRVHRQSILRQRVRHMGGHLPKASCVVFCLKQKLLGLFAARQKKHALFGTSNFG